MMALHEAEYLLPSVDSLDGPLELSCGIIAPREDSEEEDEALGMPALLPPPPSPSSVAQEELSIQPCLPLSHHPPPPPHPRSPQKASNVTWVHFGGLTPSPHSPNLQASGLAAAAAAAAASGERSGGGERPEAAATVTAAAVEAEAVASVESKGSEGRGKKACAERPNQTQQELDPLRCEHCSYRARNRHCLNNHHRQRHSGERFRHMRQCQRCPVSGCSVTKFHSSRMVQHLNAEHGARIQKVQLFFNSAEEFIRWKQAEERKIGVTFTKRTGDRHGPNMRATNYTCSRFGTQMHRYAGSSRSLRLGSGQTDDYCPSRMNVVFYDNRLMVVYFRKHSHDVAAGPDYWVDLKSLPLSAANNPLQSDKMAANQAGGSGGGAAMMAVKRAIAERPAGHPPNAGEGGDAPAAKRPRSDSFELPIAEEVVVKASASASTGRLTPVPCITAVASLASPAPPADAVCEPAVAAPPRVYSSLCDNLRAQMDSLGKSLRAGIPESLLESVMELHGVHSRLLQELNARRREKRLFPLVLRQAKAPP